MSSGKKAAIAFVIILCIVAGVLYFTVIAPGQQRSEADELRAEGKYNEAEAIYAKLNQTDEIIRIRRNLFFESRALHCALILKKSLIAPDSLSIREARVAEPTSSDGQPTVVLHYTAKSASGSTVNKYVYFSGSEYTYEMYTSVDTLDSDSIPYYLEKQEKVEWLRSILLINTVLTYSKYVTMSDEELNSLNAILSADKISSSRITDYNEIVSKPIQRD